MSYYGAYDKVLNGVADNAPTWMREQAVYGIIKELDTEFNPIFSKTIMPRTPGIDDKSRPVAVNDKFTIPYIADPGIMSQLMAITDRVEAYDVGFINESLYTRLTKQRGPDINPFEWTHQLRAGFLDKRNAMLVETAVKSIARRIEYETTNFLYGDAATIANFSDIPSVLIDRRKIFDAATGQADPAGLSGVSWDNYACDPMYDINKMNLYMNEMQSKDIKHGFIGPNTAFALEDNAKILSQIQYHVDATNTVIASTIKNVKLEKVMGQYYKDVTADSGKIGYPGRGNIEPDNWTTRSKVDMMQHTVSTTGFEWGIFTPAGPVGNVFSSKVHPKQKDPNTPYTHSWEDPELEIVQSYMALGFGPHVNDFADIIVVKRMAQKNV